MNYLYKRGCLLIVHLFLLLAAHGQNVNLKNGNFYVIYTDYSNDRPGGLKVERTFNSKSNLFGNPFGASWAQKFLYYVVPMPSGIITMYCYGGGDKRAFIPENLPETEVEKEIQLILDAKIAAGSLKTDAEIDLQRKRLKNWEIRHLEYCRLLQTGKLPPVTLPAGHRAIYKNQPKTNISVTDKGYEATLFKVGEEATFNRLGKVTRFKDEKGETFIRYDSSGNLDKITHSDGSWLKIKCDRQGRVVKIWTDKGLPISYKHRSIGLVGSKDAFGNVLEYAYDQNYNLSNIRYEDGSQVMAVHHPQDLHAISFTERNGNRRMYNYGSFDDDPANHYYREYCRVNRDGDTLLSKRYEYKDAMDSLTGLEFGIQYKEIINRTDTITKKFAPSGDIIEYARNGETVRLYRNQENVATKIEAGDGKKYLPDYDKDGRIAAIIQPGVGQFKLLHDSLKILTQVILPDGRTIPYPAADFIEYRDTQYNSLAKLMDVSGSFTDWYSCITCASWEVKCTPADGNGGLSDYRHIVERVPYRLWPDHADYFACIAKNTLNDSLRKPYMAAAAKLLRNYVERQSFAKTSNAINGKLVWYYLLSGQYEEARGWIEKIRTNDPDNPWAMRYEPLVPLLRGRWEEARAAYEKYAGMAPGPGHPDFFEPRHYDRWNMQEVYQTDARALEEGHYLSGAMAEKTQNFLRTDADWGRYYAGLADTAVLTDQKMERLRKSARHFEKAYRQHTPEVLYLLLQTQAHLGNDAPETAFTLRLDRETFAALGEYYQGRAEVSEEPSAKRAFFRKSSNYYAQLCALEPAAPERLDWIDVQENLGEKSDLKPLFALREEEKLYPFIDYFLQKAWVYSGKYERRIAGHSWWVMDQMFTDKNLPGRDSFAFAAADSLRGSLYRALASARPDTGSAARFGRYFELMDEFVGYTKEDSLQRNYRIALYREKIALLNRLIEFSPDEIKWKKAVGETIFAVASIQYDAKEYQSFYDTELAGFQRAETFAKQHPDEAYFKQQVEARRHDLGLACFHLRRLDEALEYSKKVVQSNLNERSSFVANCRIVYANLLNDQYDEAVSYYQKIRDLQSNGQSTADFLSENMNLYLERTGTDPNNPEVKRFLEFLKGQE